ncbi:hypothetical protein [Rothia sp. P4278]|uniref:hypothetical protein n=1 Tax=Rothia sp. P4278 TaxID=3402658 RepID=UPI003AEEE519
MKQDLSKQPVISKGQSLFITGSSVISAVSTFIVTWLATRSLGPQEGKDFLVFWSLTSLVFATLLGVQQESARLLGLAQQDRAGTGLKNQHSSSSPTYNPLLAAVLVGVTCSLVFLALTPVWLGTVLPAKDLRSALLIALTTTVYACHVYFIGAAAGIRAWTEYALLIATGGIFCLLCTYLASVTGAGPLGFQLSFLATAFLWIFFILFSPQIRSTLTIRLSGNLRTTYISMMLAVGTALAMAAMSTGFPVFLEATSSTSSAKEATLMAAIILGISITRAPIMLPLQAFQGVAVSYFITQSQSPARILAKPIAGLVGLGVVGALAAWLIGPLLFDLIYTQYAGQLTGPFLAALTFAAALLALTTLSGTAALAMGAHRIYLLGWVATLLTALVCLIFPLGLEARTLLALISSPLVGAAVHLAGMQALFRSRH